MVFGYFYPFDISRCFRMSEVYEHYISIQLLISIFSLCSGICQLVNINLSILHKGVELFLAYTPTTCTLAYTPTTCTLACTPTACTLGLYTN